MLSLLPLTVQRIYRCRYWSVTVREYPLWPWCAHEHSAFFCTFCNWRCLTVFFNVRPLLDLVRSRRLQIQKRRLQVLRVVWLLSPFWKTTAFAAKTNKNALFKQSWDLGVCTFEATLYRFKSRSSTLHKIANESWVRKRRLWIEYWQSPTEIGTLYS